MSDENKADIPIRKGRRITHHEARQLALQAGERADRLLMEERIRDAEPVQQEPAMIHEEIVAELERIMEAIELENWTPQQCSEAVDKLRCGVIEAFAKWGPIPNHIAKLRDEAIEDHRAGRTEPMEGML